MNHLDAPHPPLERLTDFDLGRLPPAEWTEVESHVAGCDFCCRRLESLTGDPFVQLLRSSGAAAETGMHQSASTGVSGPTGRASLEISPELADHPRYRLLEVLGAGGMGVIFKAEHRLMERMVALKVINKRLTEKPVAIERFRQEVKTAARLSHRNIVGALDAEQAGDVHFLVGPAEGYLSIRLVVLIDGQRRIYFDAIKQTVEPGEGSLLFSIGRLQESKDPLFRGPLVVFAEFPRREGATATQLSTAASTTIVVVPPAKKE